MTSNLSNKLNHLKLDNPQSKPGQAPKIAKSNDSNQVSPSVRISSEIVPAASSALIVYDDKFMIDLRLEMCFVFAAKTLLSPSDEGLYNGTNYNYNIQYYH